MTMPEETFFKRVQLLPLTGYENQTSSNTYERIKR